MKYTTHKAYSVLKLANRGEYPDGRTHLGRALENIRSGLAQHYHPLSYPQELTLFRLVALYGFWLQHPGTVKEGTLSVDWKDLEKRIERLELTLSQQEKDKGRTRVVDVPDLKQIIFDAKEDALEQEEGLRG